MPDEAKVSFLALITAIYSVLPTWQALFSALRTNELFRFSQSNEAHTSIIFSLRIGKLRHRALLSHWPKVSQLAGGEEARLEHVGSALGPLTPTCSVSETSPLCLTLEAFQRHI